MWCRDRCDCERCRESTRCASQRRGWRRCRPDETVGPASRHHRCLVDPPPPSRQGLELSRRRRTRDPRSRDGAPAGAAGGAAGLCRRALRQGCRRAPAGDRPRRRRPAAVPLSSGLGQGARAAQGAPPGAAGGCAAAHPPQHRPASFRRRADARIRARCGDRAGRDQRHPPRQRELRAPARHARRGDAVEVERYRLRRDHHAHVPLQGRQDHRQGIRLAAAGGGVRGAPPVAGAAAVPLPRRRRRGAPRHRARGQPLPARGGGARISLRAHISLKDFRTLLASASVLEALARTEPAASERQRRRQVLKAVRAAADDLANTPAICRKSYVHDTVVAAFEDGVLERFADTLKACRSATRRAQVLAQIIATAACSPTGVARCVSMPSPRMPRRQMFRARADHAQAWPRAPYHPSPQRRTGTLARRRMQRRARHAR